MEIKKKRPKLYGLGLLCVLSCLSLLCLFLFLGSAEVLKV